MTQQQIVKSMLDSGEWVCGNKFLEAYIPEYRSRINELRKQGHNIITRRCLQHHHKGITQEWCLIPAPSAPITPKAQEFLARWATPVKKELTSNTLW